jgi:hypothetical protein
MKLVRPLVILLSSFFMCLQAAQFESGHEESSLSMPSVSSQYEGAKHRTIGSSVVISYRKDNPGQFCNYKKEPENCQRVILSVGHVLQGRDKRYCITPDECYPIRDEDALLCNQDDVAIIKVPDDSKLIPFADYSHLDGAPHFSVFGANNSPSVYTQGENDFVSTTLAGRPIPLINPLSNAYFNLAQSDEFKKFAGELRKNFPKANLKLLTLVAVGQTQLFLKEGINTQAENLNGRIYIQPLKEDGSLEYEDESSYTDMFITYDDFHRIVAPTFYNLRTNEAFYFMQAEHMEDRNSRDDVIERLWAHHGNAGFVVIPPMIAGRIHNQTSFRQSFEEQGNRKLGIKEKAFSGDLVAPMGVVGGVSGSPLIRSFNAEMGSYSIKGLTVQYDRMSERSYFVGENKILQCFHSFLQNKRGERNNISGQPVRWAYEPKTGTTIRTVPGRIYETALGRENAGSILFGDAGGNDAGDSGGNDAGDSGGNDAGDSGGNDAGDSGGNDAGDSGGNDAGDSGGNDAGDSGGNDAGDSGGNDAGDSGSNDAGDSSLTSAQACYDFINNPLLKNFYQGIEDITDELTLLPGLYENIDGEYKRVIGYCVRRKKEDPCTFIYANWDAQRLRDRYGKQLLFTPIFPGTNLTDLFMQRMGVERKKDGSWPNFKSKKLCQKSNDRDICTRIEYKDGKLKIKVYESSGLLAKPISILEFDDTGKYGSYEWVGKGVLKFKREDIFLPKIETPNIAIKYIVDLRGLYFTDVGKIYRDENSSDDPLDALFNSQGTQLEVSRRYIHTPKGEPPVPFLHPPKR